MSGINCCFIRRSNVWEALLQSAAVGARADGARGGRRCYLPSFHPYEDHYRQSYAARLWPWWWWRGAHAKPRDQLSLSSLRSARRKCFAVGGQLERSGDRCGRCRGSDNGLWNAHAQPLPCPLLFDGFPAETFRQELRSHGPGWKDRRGSRTKHTGSIRSRRYGERTPAMASFPRNDMPYVDQLQAFPCVLRRRRNAALRSALRRPNPQGRACRAAPSRRMLQRR